MLLRCLNVGAPSCYRIGAKPGTYFVLRHRQKRRKERKKKKGKKEKKEKKEKGGRRRGFARVARVKIKAGGANLPYFGRVFIAGAFALSSDFEAKIEYYMRLCEG